MNCNDVNHLSITLEMFWPCSTLFVLSFRCSLYSSFCKWWLHNDSYE